MSTICEVRGGSSRIFSALADESFSFSASSTRKTRALPSEAGNSLPFDGPHLLDFQYASRATTNPVSVIQFRII
jgi:hypothetical protein